MKFRYHLIFISFLELILFITYFYLFREMKTLFLILIICLVFIKGQLLRTSHLSYKSLKIWGFRLLNAIYSGFIVYSIINIYDATFFENWETSDQLLPYYLLIITVYFVILSIVNFSIRIQKNMFIGNK